MCEFSNSMEVSPSREAASCAATQELLVIYGTQRFITVFTRVLHPSVLSQISPALISQSLSVQDPS
jgi:hypothetical protein